jgi:DNA-directed RNA polymerase subunit N (RpoN/RPB10)
MKGSGKVTANLTRSESQPVIGKMIIPVRCMNCGKLLADKWLHYQRRLQELQGDGYGKRTYFDGSVVPKTKEAEVMKELGLTR